MAVFALLSLLVMLRLQKAVAEHRRAALGSYKVRWCYWGERVLSTSGPSARSPSAVGTRPAAPGGQPENIFLAWDTNPGDKPAAFYFSLHPPSSVLTELSP